MTTRVAERKVPTIGSRLDRRLAAGLILACMAIAAGTVTEAWRDGRGRDTAREIVALANAVRLRHGLRPLTESAALNRAAEHYARDLTASESFDHVGPDGSTVDLRAEAHGYGRWSVVAENLASGTGTADAADIIEAWMRSPGHRENLLASDLDDAGAGCAVAPRGEPRFVCVLEFGSRERLGVAP